MALDTKSGIHVTGHHGLIGSAALRVLVQRGCANVILRSGRGLDVIDAAGELAAAAVGFDSNIERDPSKPDGAPRELVDSGRMRWLGCSPLIDLHTGIRLAQDSYREHFRKKP